MEKCPEIAKLKIQAQFEVLKLEERFWELALLVKLCLVIRKLAVRAQVPRLKFEKGSGFQLRRAGMCPRKVNLEK